MAPAAGAVRCMVQEEEALTAGPEQERSARNAHSAPTARLLLEGRGRCQIGIAAGIVLALLAALFLVVEAVGVAPLANPAPWLYRQAPQAAALGVGLLVVDALFPVPSSLVMITLGMRFGGLLGTLLSLAGSIGSGMLGFAIGRRGGPLLGRLLSSDSGQAQRLVQRFGVVAIVATRPLPLLAETVMILSGASQLAWHEAFVAAAVGSVPTSVLYAVLGAVATTPAQMIAACCLCVLLAATCWYGGRVAKRLAGRSGSEQGPASGSVLSRGLEARDDSDFRSEPP